MRFRTLLLLIGLAIGFCFNSSNAEENHQNLLEKFQIVQKSAHKGSAEAQFQLAVCYLEGVGTNKNINEAIKWLKKSASQGYLTAQTMMGTCYEKGEGFKQSDEEAVRWYRKAAEKNQSDAQYRLGLCYLRGKGVEKSKNEAISWFKKSAELGNVYGQSALGDCYGNGEGVPQDYAETLKWYRKAAEQGSTKVQYLLGYLCAEGLLHDYKEAVKWYKKAADAGSVEAQCELGKCYAKGLGVEKSIKEALRLFDLAANAGYKEAELNFWFYKDYPVNSTQELPRTFTISQHRNSIDIHCDQDVITFATDFTSESIYFYKRLGYTGLKNLSPSLLEKLAKDQDYVEILKHTRTEDCLNTVIEVLSPYANKGHTILMFEISRTYCLAMEKENKYSEEMIIEAYNWWFKGCTSIELDVACNVDETTKAAVESLAHFFDPSSFIPQEIMKRPKNIGAIKKSINTFCSTWTPPIQYPSPKWVLYHGAQGIEGLNSLYHPAKWNELRQDKFNHIILKLKQ